jgi:hypothetical protein
VSENTSNPWVVQEAKKWEPLPVGAYTGVFKGVEAFELKGESKWRFIFEVATPAEHKGKTERTLVSPDVKPTTHAGQIISGLLGKALVPGENVEQAIKACVGQAYIFSIQPGPKGGKPAVRMVMKSPPK